MNYSFLTKTALFRGADEAEVQAMLHCLDAREKSYGKGDVIYHAGEGVQAMGLVLGGSSLRIA